MLEFENKLIVMFPVLLCIIINAFIKPKELQIPDFYLSAGKSFLYLLMRIYCFFILFIDNTLPPEIGVFFVLIITISMLESIHNFVRACESFLERRQYERAVYHA